MEKPDKYRAFSFEDFRRYNQGEMSFEEQHLLEKQMLEDAFTAEAYAGFLALEEDKKDLPEMSPELSQQLENRLGNARKILVPVWVYGAAASLLISIGILWTVILTHQKTEISSSAKEVSARKVPETPKAVEQEEMISAHAPSRFSNPQPPTESKPENERKTHSYTVENSVVADSHKAESLYAETVPRQQQIFKDKKNRIATADKVLTEPGFLSEKMISRNEEVNADVPAVVPEDENTEPDSANESIISSSSRESRKNKNEMPAAAAPVIANKQSSSVRAEASAMPETGWKNYQEYLQKNAGSAGINADVTVTFIINPDGSLTRFSATGEKQLHKRAIRIIRKGPAWRHAGTGSSQPAEITIHFRK